MLDRWLGPARPFHTCEMIQHVAGWRDESGETPPQQPGWLGVWINTNGSCNGSALPLEALSVVRATLHRLVKSHLSPERLRKKKGTFPQRLNQQAPRTIDSTGFHNY